MHIYFGDVLFQLVVFVLLFLFLRRVAFKPIMKMMSDRQSHIESQIATAEQNRVEAEKLAAEHRASIQAAKKEAADMLENARRSGEKQAADIIAAAEAEAKRVKTEAIADIQREKEIAMADLRDQIGALSVELAGKIVGKELDAKAHKTLFEEAVKEMGERVC